jgi:hypothetical protein
MHSTKSICSSAPEHNAACGIRVGLPHHRLPSTLGAQLPSLGRALYLHNAAAAGDNNLFLSSDAFVLVSV